MKKKKNMSQNSITIIRILFTVKVEKSFLNKEFNLVKIKASIDVSWFPFNTLNCVKEYIATIIKAFLVKKSHIIKSLHVI